MLRHVALPLVVVLAAGPSLAASASGPSAAPPSASAPAPAPAAASAPAPAPGQREAKYAVVLKDGTTLPCVDPPLVALGRVLYRSPDGARRALPVDQVDLDKTRPATARTDGPIRPVSHAQAQVLPPAPAAASRRGVPDFTARRADGTQVKLSELKGKVVLVDFWATWCGPCIAEMPNVKRLHAKHAGKDFEIVGVSLDFEREKLDAYMKAQEIPWPQYFDGKGWGNAVAQQYGVQSIPMMFLLDRDGRVARAGVRGPQLEPAVAELVAEGKPKAPAGG